MGVCQLPMMNTDTRYGSVTKSFHWLTALLILAIILIGLFANDLARAIRDPEIATTDADISRAAFLFSWHKTLGVAVFFVALLRILWAVTQPKPGLLNGDNPPEAMAAETVHWLLYGSLVALPLSGWVHHASTTGFAPIWWPFGQSLPLVPLDAYVSEIARTLHHVAKWVLAGAVTAHILGALKHHVIDRDATLRRMWFGRTDGQPTETQPGHASPLIAALAVWAVALGLTGWLGWFPERDVSPRTALAAVNSDWTVRDGTLGITITQLGSSVTGEFSDWTADITYDETPAAGGKHGDVTVTIATGSLDLGIVTGQAMGPDFLNVEAFPTARFTADLVTLDEELTARGILTIRETSVALQFPVTLSIEGDTATARADISVDRRDFAIGQSVGDQGSLGFDVDIRFELTATR